jgi:hypothetical protein
VLPCERCIAPILSAILSAITDCILQMMCILVVCIQVEHEIGAAAFSTTIQCRDLQYSRRSSSSAHSSSSSSNHEHVCLKVTTDTVLYYYSYCIET